MMKKRKKKSNGKKINSKHVDNFSEFLNSKVIYMGLRKDPITFTMGYLEEWYYMPLNKMKQIMRLFKNSKNFFRLQRIGVD